VRRADMTNPGEQRRCTGGDTGLSWSADIWSFLKVRTALKGYQAQDKQMAIKKWKGMPAFRFARLERYIRTTWTERLIVTLSSREIRVRS